MVRKCDLAVYNKKPPVLPVLTFQKVAKKGQAPEGQSCLCRMTIIQKGPAPEGLSGLS